MNSLASLVSPSVCRKLAPLWLHVPVDGEQVIEYAARTIDGAVEIRTTRDEDPKYPAERWARDQQALGGRVQRRRIIVLDDWADLPRPGHG